MSPKSAIARAEALILEVLDKGPAATTKLHLATAMQFKLDNIPALTQHQILRLLYDMERSGAVSSSVDASQSHLVWQLIQDASKI